MTGAYFAAFVTLPVVIKAAGQYLTRSGETVTIETVSNRHDFGCKGRYSDGTSEGWHRSGRLFKGFTSANDIVAEVTA
jgi:hypothetical protein